MLWDEWIRGINGNPPVSTWCPGGPERGANKSTFCKRKVVWDRIALLINAGYTSTVACNMITEAYGGQSVTKIILAMMKDRRNGTWPDGIRVGDA